MSQLEEMAKRLPLTLADLLTVPGLGPQRVRAIYDDLGVRTLEELALAAREGRLRRVRGLGPQTERRVIEGLERLRAGEHRHRFAVAEQVAEPLLAHLCAASGVAAASTAGSYRRRQETVGRLGFVATPAPGADLTRLLATYEDVTKLTPRGPGFQAAKLRQGLEATLRLADPAAYGTALLEETGAQGHVAGLRRLARAQGLTLNERGLFRGDERIAGGERGRASMPRSASPTSSRSCARAVASWRRPAHGELPPLIALGDIRGDLHVHTDESDGHAPLEAMVAAATARGYQYIAITDHSVGIPVTNGLDRDRLRDQMRRIDEINARGGIHVLKGSEVDILEDGSLALPDDVLGELDVVVCSIHSYLALPQDRQTARLLRAMDNPYCTILAHPTERKIGSRPAMALDMARVIAGAAERGVALEINAQPDRLDLDDALTLAAKRRGVRVSIGSDAHGIGEYGFMRFGVYQARRGWLAPADVLNALPLDDLLRAIERR